MITHHYTLHPSFNRLPRIINMLDALQHNRPGPIFFQEGDLVPGVRGPGEDVGFPFPGGLEDIVFDCFAGVVFLEFAPEDGV